MYALSGKPSVEKPKQSQGQTKRPNQCSARIVVRVSYLALPHERPLPVVFDPPVHVPQLVIAPEHEHFLRVLNLAGTKAVARGCIVRYSVKRRFTGGHSEALNKLASTGSFLLALSETDNPGVKKAA